MTDLLQKVLPCFRFYPSVDVSIGDFDPHEAGGKIALRVQFTFCADRHTVVAAPDVNHRVPTRHRHSRRLSVEHGQDSTKPNRTFLGACGQNEI